jgi:cation diffusion facilitator CzcD-associated flavoprotein CzcO
MNNLFAAAIVGENPEAYKVITQSCQDNLQSVEDPVLREKLTPNYKVGCKRLVMSDSFYDDIQKPNVALITDAIDSICARGIRTADGELHELDILVMATGFDPHRFLRPMDVRGLNGIKLEEEWADQNRSYLTVTVPEFPNFFMLGGPSSPIGNFSYLLTAETQIGFILQLVERLLKGDVSAISPRKSKCIAFNDALQEKMSATVWTSGCTSWYLDKNGNVASWPWSYDKFIADLRIPRWDDFELV